MDEDEYVDNSQNGNDSNVLVFRLNQSGSRRRRAASVLTDKRHAALLGGLEVSHNKVARWRMRDRMKTVGVALVYCLNIGVDPPDVIKPEPCARLECWIDPLALPAVKALDAIGKALQAQYERWQPRARYKPALDPTVDDVKKLCLSLRRNAKDERVLLHYTGHGVPRPTSNGELWVFNKNFTQYIPLSIYELQTWVGSPSIYVLDCSAAGLIVNWFLQFADQRDNDSDRMPGGPASTAPMRDFILLAACGANELLPMNAELPADVFTSCLTTPIKMALRWFCSHSFLSKGRISPELIDKIPGRLTDRRTPLGELNWIFTAITDTIAWNLLPRELFQKLFRQDLLVASLFRNLLLAERIMRSFNCTPVSYPRLPPTYQHSMWDAWDLAVDICLAQLPDMMADPSIDYRHSSFFSEQLTAFEVWLEFGAENKKPPEQLPIVLQVLLSQVHRLRALVLLGKFLDLGPWAVNLALSVGIFPYVLKLLQSPAAELRQILVFIWTKILALDKSCQVDLVKDNGYSYFITMLSSSAPSDQPLRTSGGVGGASVPADQRQMAAFVLASIVNNCRPGQSACLTGNMLPVCMAHLNDPEPALRKWLVLLLAKLWESYEDAKWAAIRDGLMPDRLCQLLTDPDAQVRAAAVYAVGTFIGGGEGNEVRSNIELNLALALPLLTEDASPLVRTELLVTLSRFVRCYERPFSQVALEAKAADDEKQLLREQQERERRRAAVPGKSPIKGQPATPDGGRRSRAATPEPELSPPVSPLSAPNSIFRCLWDMIAARRSDPYAPIAQTANELVQAVYDKLQQLQHLQPPVLLAPQPRQATTTTSSSGGGGGLASLARKAGLKLRNSTSFGAPTLAASGTGSTPGSSPPDAQQPVGGNGGPGRRPRSAQLSLSVQAGNAVTGSVTGSLHMSSSSSSAGGMSGSGSLKKMSAMDFSKLPDGARGDDDESIGASANQGGANFEDVQLVSSLFDWCSDAFNKPLTVANPVSNNITITNDKVAGDDDDDDDDDDGRRCGQARWERQRNAAIKAEAKLLRRADSFADMYQPQPPAAAAAEPNNANAAALSFGGRLSVRPQRTSSGGSSGPHTPSSPASSSGSSSGSMLDSMPAMLTNMPAAAAAPPSAAFQQAAAGKVRVTKLDEQLAILDNSPERPASLLLHAFAPLVVVADDKDGISVWERQGGTKLNRFYNRSLDTGPYAARTTSMVLLNDDCPGDDNLLLAGSEDGVVRIWSHYDDPDKLSLVSAWRALPLAGTGGAAAGLVVDWQPKRAQLMAAGDADIIRVWDLVRELRVQDMPTGSDSAVTSLAHSKDGAGLLVAGCADGSVRVFDPRSPSRSSPVCTFAEHQKDWIVNVQCPKSSGDKIISGSLSGCIKFWDVRKCASFRTMIHSKMTMTAMAVHDYAPLLACGTQNQKIKVYDFAGELLSLIRYHDGFLGQRIGPVSCLSFHPYLALLAAGATDSIVSLYTRSRS
eukprot:TRINITY_DN354_c0_g2_i1.p1 TRINITY_DN354_c0_g2~~TRINITY_DN354_c0_g2_i1.p1  ORF type:complete len:1471 (+),score=651.08 TRINITY_DN354_c0_g2_i1:184-4596(+)